MRKIIWLDGDGVLLEFTDEFLRFTGLHNRGVTYPDVIQYDLSVFFGNRDEFISAMDNFHRSDVFKSLRPQARCTDIEALRNMGYEVRVLTQVHYEPEVRANRISNLTLAYGAVFNDIHFTNIGQCKLDYIRMENPTGQNILVEDKPDPIEKWYHNTVGYSPIFSQGMPLECVGYVHPYNELKLAQMPNLLKIRGIHELTRHLAIRKGSINCPKLQ